MYVGPLCAGGTCLQRMNAMIHLGHIVHEIDTEPLQVHKIKSELTSRITRKLYRLGLEIDSVGKDISDVNNSIVSNINNTMFDLIWIDKGLVVTQETMMEIKNRQPDCIIAGYSPDDMSARHNQTPQFLRSIKYYDVYFTTKSYGVKELESLGCRRVIFCGNAYDPFLHRPIQIDEETKKLFGGPVGFIGDYERERAESIHSLAKAGIPVRIWGPNWHRFRCNHPLIRIENKSVWGDDYAKSICSFDINLCFLRKINRDLQTTRSIEIPACGGFMLGERTKEHQDLFMEGIEAEFFSSNDELIEKTIYYIENMERRKSIAMAGRERCINSRYSNLDRISEMISACFV